MKKLIPLCAAAMLPILPAAAEVKLSERLTKIAGHLGEGGVHFSVTDSKNDLKDLAVLIDKVLTIVPEGEIPPGLKVESLFDDLGLYALEGRGSSTHKVGDLWHNRSFILTNGKHEAALSLFGDEAKKAAAHEFAPAGADLVLETSLNLREVERTARKVSKAFGGDAEQEVGYMLAEKVADLGLSLADIFADFTVHGTLVFWLDEEKTFEMGPETELPVPHFAARLDNAGMVWKLLKSAVADQSIITEQGDDVILTPKDAKEESPFGPIEPQFVWNAKTKQLFFSLNAADLATCRGDGDRLTADADYQTATTGFPEKTNGLAYASKDLLMLTTELAKLFSGELPPEAQGIVAEVLPFLEKLAKKGGYAGAYAVEDDGFLFVANLPLPMKGESSMMGLGGIGAIAVLAGMATPLIVKAQNAGDDTQMLMYLKSYANAQTAYQLDYGNYASSIEDLVKDKAYLDDRTADSLLFSGFESLVDEKFAPKGIAIMAFCESQASPDSILAAWTDGSARKITGEELEAQLAKQGE